MRINLNKVIIFIFLLSLIGCTPIEYKTFEYKASLLTQQVLKSGKYGEYDNYVTIWDCGEYGVLTSEDQNIFNKSRLSNKLILGDYGDYIAIEDIIV